MNDISSKALDLAANYYVAVKERFDESTVVSTVFLPAAATVDKFVLEMDTLDSLETRGAMIGLIYGVIMPLVYHSRDYLVEKFNVKELTAERVVSGVAGFFAKPISYLIGGGVSAMGIVTGTALITGASFFLGPVAYKIFDKVSSMSKNKKALFLSSMVTASVAGTVAIYSTGNDELKILEKQVTTEYQNNLIPSNTYNTPQGTFLKILN